MSKLRVGLVGAGSIAQFHVQSYAKHPDVEIVGVADLKLDRAQAMASAYGIPNTFDNHHDLLAMDGLDAISVCTWNNSHAEVSIDALNAGKDVLCEKPLSRTVAEALEVQKAVGATGRVLEVGYVRRYGLNTQILKKFVDSGDLGDIYYSKASSIRRMGNPGGWFADVKRSGGGPLIDIGVHVIDLAWYLMGSPKPVTVSGNSYHYLGNRANVIGKARYQVSDYDPTQNTVEDMANAVIRFENGASLLVDVAFSLHASEDTLAVAVFGEKGGAELEPSLLLVSEQHDTLLNIVPQLDYSTFRMDEGFQTEIDHFVSLCEGEAGPNAPVEHGVALMKMLRGVYESAESGREIQLD